MEYGKRKCVSFPVQRVCAGIREKKVGFISYTKSLRWNTGKESVFHFPYKEFVLEYGKRK
jgi:hypothetical protein